MMKSSWAFGGCECTELSDFRYYQCSVSLSSLYFTHLPLTALHIFSFFLFLKFEAQLNACTRKHKGQQAHSTSAEGSQFSVRLRAGAFKCKQNLNQEKNFEKKPREFVAQLAGK